MVIKQFKLTSEHVKKLTELGYRKVKLKDSGCDIFIKRTISGRSRIEVVYYEEISWLCIDTYHKKMTVSHIRDVSKLYDEYVHVYQTLKEDMEKIFGLDITLEQMIKEN